MYKGIEWLKAQICTEMMYLDHIRKERWSGVKYQTLRSVYQKINQLDETEVLSQELPEIPKYVADWVEEVKDKEWTLYGAMSECPREVDYWLIDGDCSNQDTFARAWLDGYTVEKEQKYYAKIKGWELFVDFVGAQYWGVVSNYGRLGFVNVDGAKDRTKDEWRRLGINDSNAEFVKVGEQEADICNK